MTPTCIGYYVKKGDGFYYLVSGQDDGNTSTVGENGVLQILQKNMPGVLKVGQRVVAQWGGNNKWYSGKILAVPNGGPGQLINRCHIWPDDGVTAKNKAGWTNLSPARVFKSSDTGSEKKWCWRAAHPHNCPDTYELERSTGFVSAVRPVGDGGTPRRRISRRPLDESRRRRTGKGKGKEPAKGKGKGNERPDGCSPLQWKMGRCR
jgi:hypothetical protein